MELPDDSIGISDLKDWQECPRRMSFKVQRFTEEGAPPEAEGNPTTRYGTAIHDAIEFVERTDCTNDDAVQHLLSNGHRWIDPEVAADIRADLDVYRERDPLGVRTVMVEGDIRVPIQGIRTSDGREVYYRAKIDRLYEYLDRPGHFLLRDYKSSRWPKTKAEVDDDKQMTAYDWALHEFMPEIEHLDIEYDQLNFGVIPTSRTDDERLNFEVWLRQAVVAVLDDDEVGPDGLLVPSFNQWCPYCPIKMSCAVVPRLTQYAQAEIAKLAPSRKEGRKSVVDLDPDLFDVYVAALDEVATARGVLESFEKAVKARLKDMPLDERAKYGYALQTRTLDVFSPEALGAIHRLLGDAEFYRLVSLSKEAVTRAVGSDETKLKLIVGMADKRSGSPFVKKKGGPRPAKGRGRASRGT